MFVTFTMRDAIAHEGWLRQPDNVKAESLAPGGGLAPFPLSAC